MTPRSKQFAENVSRLVGPSANLIAMELGIPYKRWWRWLTAGIERPTRKTYTDLEKLRGRLGLASVQDLWGEDPAHKYSERVRIILGNPMPAAEREQLCQLVDQLWDALTVVHTLSGEFPTRFKISEKNIAGALRQLRGGVSVELLIDAVREDLTKPQAEE